MKSDEGRHRRASQVTPTYGGRWQTKGDVVTCCDNTSTIVNCFSDILESRVGIDIRTYGNKGNENSTHDRGHDGRTHRIHARAFLKKGLTLNIVDYS